MAYLLFQQILSLFIIMALGFTLVKTGLLKSTDSKALSVMCIYIIVPCVVIKSFQMDLTDEVKEGFLLAVLAAVLTQCALLLVSFAYKKLLHLDAVERASAIYSNAGNLIIPIVSAILGEEWVVYTSAFICVQLLFLWTHGQAVISGEKGFRWKKLLGNMNIIAIFVGIILMVTGLRLPKVVNASVDLLSGTIGPVSMLMVGMLMAGADLKAVFTNPRVYLIAALRLLVTPTLMLLLMAATGIVGLAEQGHMILYISFMAMMTPAATTVTQLAVMHNNRPDLASAVNVLTTLLCIATMPLMTQLYQWIIGGI